MAAPKSISEADLKVKTKEMIKENLQTDGQLLKLVSSLAKTEVVSLETLDTLKTEVISEIQ